VQVSADRYSDYDMCLLRFFYFYLYFFV